MSEITPRRNDSPAKLLGGANTGVVPFGRNWRIAREFSDQELEHVKRSRHIEHVTDEELRKQQGEAALGAASIQNATKLAEIAQDGVARVINRRDELIAQAQYEKSAEDILHFTDSLASELGRVAAAAIQKQKR
ncbi:hypothetical protein [Arthrobacter sp. D2-10]